jgi:signal transduction histidine kinase
MTSFLQNRVFPWQRSIQNRLIVFALMFSLVPATTVGILAFSQARETLYDEFGTAVQQLTVITGADTQALNKTGLDSIHLIAQFPVWGTELNGDTVSPEQQAAFMRSLEQVYPIYDALYTVDTSGKILASTNDAIQNLSHQAWFQQAVQGHVTASDVYYLASIQENVITFAAPIMASSGDIQGVIAGDIRGQTVNDILAEHPLGKSGDVFMVNQQGQIVADSVPEEVFSDVADLPPVQAALRGETGTSIDVDPHTGETSLFAYAPVPGTQNWVAIGQVPVSELNVPLDELANRTRLVSLLAALAVITVILLVSRRNIVRPLRQLTASARQLTSGSYTPVPVRSRDEFGQLAAAFNEMADAIQQRDKRLQELVATLEQRVLEAQAAREQAERSDRVKSAFLASMSHELRTPLNAVINFTKFVIKGMMGPVTERQTESLSKVVDSAKHLLNLINDVLDMSKIESGSLNLFVEENVDVTTILLAVASTAEGLLVEKPVKLQLDFDENLPLMTGDKQRIRQILLNIVSNACKFTESGTITISAHVQADEIQIAVRDTGAGIEPEDAAAVFEPFKQTETGLRQGAGTGLGMPISKNLAEAHGGRLWFASTPGQGTTFFVSLPVKSDKLVPVLA